MRGLKIVAVAALVLLCGCATPSTRQEAERLASACGAREAIDTPNFYDRMTLQDIESKYACVRNSFAASPAIISNPSWDLVSTGMGIQEALRREVAQQRMTPEEATLRWANYENQLRSIRAQRDASAAQIEQARSAALLQAGILMQQYGQASAAPTPASPRMMTCWRSGHFVNCSY